jgi:hypothetical protein
MSETQIVRKVTEIAGETTSFVTSAAKAGSDAIANIVRDYRAVLTVSALFGTIIPGYHIVATEFYTFLLMGAFGVMFVKLGGLSVLLAKKEDVAATEADDS